MKNPGKKPVKQKVTREKVAQDFARQKHNKSFKNFEKKVTREDFFNA